MWSFIPTFVQRVLLARLRSGRLTLQLALSNVSCQYHNAVVNQLQLLEGS